MYCKLLCDKTAFGSGALILLKTFQASTGEKTDVICKHPYVDIQSNVRMKYQADVRQKYQEACVGLRGNSLQISYLDTPNPEADPSFCPAQACALSYEKWFVYSSDAKTIRQDKEIRQGGMHNMFVLGE